MTFLGKYTGVYNIFNNVSIEDLALVDTFFFFQL